MISKYGAAYTIAILNGRKLSNWSSDDSPIQIQTMEDLRDIEIHHGGGGVLTERISSGAILTVSLQPGTPDSSFCSGLYLSGAEIEFIFTNIGTGEKLLLSGGVSTKLGDINRGFKPSNDNYTFKFLKIVPVMGS